MGWIRRAGKLFEQNSLRRSQARRRRSVVRCATAIGTRAAHVEPLEQRQLLALVTSLLFDVNPSTASAGAGSILEVGALTFFAANNGANGYELWKSDGTSSGTMLVKDIRTGANNSNPNSNPNNFTNVDGTLYFTASGDANGTELWKSDGTSSGTTLVKDICAGTTGSYPRYLVNVGGTLYFQANDGVNGYELWKSDGASSGTLLVKDIRAGSSASILRYLTNVGGTLYFRAWDGVNGYELWKSNGTSSGTVLVKDILVGAVDSGPRSLTNVGGMLYFSANDGVHGDELWRSDGTSSGTTLVKDIRAGSSASYLLHVTNVGGTLYFRANDGANGLELWKSDGTSSGTVLVKDILVGAGSPYLSNLRNLNGTLYFRANNGVNGDELWRSDGTSSGTTLVKDIRAGAFGSNLNFLMNANGTLYFRANDGANGLELWKSDGTSLGTTLVEDIRAGANGSIPSSLTNSGGTLYFWANDGIHGYELWTTIGFAPGTPALATGNDTGVSSTDRITKLTTPTIAGTALQGTTVTIFADGVAVGTGTITGGRYSIVISALTPGVHTITAVANDPIAGDSPPSPAMSMTIDTTPPVVSLAPPTPDPRTTSLASATINFDTATYNLTTSSLRLTRDGGSNLLTASQTVNTAGNLVWTLNNLSTITNPAGVYTLTFSAAGTTASDVAGNSAANDSSVNFTRLIDVPSAPVLAAGNDTGVSTADRITKINTPTFTGTSNGSSVTIYANGVAVGTGQVVNGSYSITTSALADATWSITAIATSGVQTSAASAATSVTIDTTAPTTVGLQLYISDYQTTSIASETATFSEGVYGVTTAAFRFTLNGGADMVAGAGASVVALDQSRWQASGQSRLPLPSGLYRGALVANNSGITDAAGNALSAGATTSLQYNVEPQARPNNEFYVTGPAGNYWEMSPDLALDAQSNLVAVWLRTVNPASPPPSAGQSGQTGLIMQRFDASGNAVGDERLITVRPSGGFAAIDSADDGRSVVAWLERDNVPSPGAGASGLWAQLLDTQSNPVGVPFRVESATAGAPVFHTLTVQPNGEFVLSWSTAGHEIYYRRFSAAGAAQGSEVLVVSNLNVAGQHDFAIDPQGNAVVTWVETVQGNDNIYFRRFDANGAPLGASPTLVSAVTGSLTSAMVALAADGQFTILASTGFALSIIAVPTGPPTVRFWQFSATGELLGGPIQVNQTDTYGGADVQYTPAGELLFTWNEGNSNSTQTGNILLRRYSHAGAPLDLAPRVISTLSNQPAPTQLDVNALGDYVVAWNRDIPLIGPTNRVEAMAYVGRQTLAWNLAPVSSAFTVGMPVAPNFDMDPDVAVDAQGNFGVVWISQTPFQQVVPEVQYRRYDANGAPTGNVQTLNGPEGATLGGAARISSAPNGRAVAVWIAGQSSQPKSLWARLIDAQGLPQLTPIRVDTDVNSYPTQGAVAVADSGAFVIAWITSTNQVRVRRFTSDGTPLGDEFVVGNSGTFSNVWRYNLDVDANAAGDFIVSWLGYLPDQSRPIMFQRYHADGTAIDPAPVSTALDYNSSVFIVTASLNDSGDFAIGWVNPHSLLLGYGQPILPSVRLYSRTGIPKSGVIVLDKNPTISQIDVFLDQAGDLTVTYDVPDDPLLTASPRHVVIRRIQGDARLAISDPITVSDSGPFRAAATLAMSPSGAVAVVWNNQEWDALAYAYSDFAVVARLYKPALNVAIASPTSGYRGEALQFTFSASGTNVTPTTAVKYSIDWDGNGTIDQTVQGQASGVTATHAYFTSAVQLPNVTASTAAATSRREVRSVTITDYVLRPNATNAALTDLIWGGSELDDHVVFSQTGASDIALQTLIDSGTAVNTTRNISGVTGRVIAYGNPGSDTLDASGLSTKQATLDGGAGNNTLRGGNGGDVLIGGTDGAEGSPNGHRDGNNVIIAGNGANTIYGNGLVGKKEQTGGNNLIIGGSGADTIYGNYGVNNQPMADGGEGGFNLLIGGAGADTIYTTQSADGGEGSHGSIVVGGTTTYGTNAAGIAALQSILAEWSSGHALSAKRSYILGTGGSGGLNGTNYLTPGGTVLNDAAIDSIFGDTNGSAHWFFYRISQDLLSRSKAEDLQTNVP